MKLNYDLDCCFALADVGLSSGIAYLNPFKQSIYVDMRIITSPGSKSDRRGHRSTRRQYKNKSDRKYKIREFNEKYLNVSSEEMSSNSLRCFVKAVEESVTNSELASVFSWLSKHRGNWYPDTQKNGREFLNEQEEFIGFIKDAINRKSKLKVYNKGKLCSREMLRIVAQQIISTQVKSQQNSLTADSGDMVFNLIFYQRPTRWRQSTVDMCPIIPTDHVLPRCDRYAQDFIIIGILVNLKINGEKISSEDLCNLYKMACKENITYTKLTKFFGTDQVQGFDKKSTLNKHWFYAVVCPLIPRSRFDDESSLIAINKYMVKRSGNYSNPEILRSVLNSLNWTKSEVDTFINDLTKILPRLPDGRIAYSRNALLKKKLLETMKSNVINVNAAIKYLGLKEFRRDYSTKIPSLPNAYANSSLVKLLPMIKSLDSKFGLKNAIFGVETTRDFRHPKNVRKKNENEARKRETNRRNACDVLEKMNVPCNNIDRLLGWLESGKKDWHSGKPVTFEDAVSGKYTHNEHIVPKSRGGHDTPRNKMFISQYFNQKVKVDRLLSECLPPEQVQEIAKHYKNNRTERFMGKTFQFSGDKQKVENILCTEASKYTTEWKASHLPSTSYVENKLRDVLPDRFSTIDGHIHRIPSKAVDYLRKHWNLVDCLKTQSGNKRDDYRHHIIDSILGACCLIPDILRQIKYRIDKGVPYNKEKIILPPWGTIDQFRNQVKQIVSSYIVRFDEDTKPLKSLHAQNPIGVYDKSRSLYTRKRPLDEYLGKNWKKAQEYLSYTENDKTGKKGRIANANIANSILSTLCKENIVGNNIQHQVKQLIEDGKLPRSVKIIIPKDNVAIVPEKDRNDNIIGERYYENKDSNYRAIIYKDSNKWKMYIETRYEYLKNKKLGKNNIDGKDVVMVLFKNSTIMVDGEYYRVLSMKNVKSPEITVCKHFDANGYTECNFSAKKMFEKDAKKVRWHQMN